MKISRLRLLGFKSFVEPTELDIEAGLTGVVGPNGCGKSNLLEALRWVMGETSYKSMRASSMDDVIFSGTTQRPSRNAAEVTIFVDNHARTAPAELNDADVIEITRRIERESGSNYRVNGKDVRARDIKILFEDAATGARSPALVRQGQIAEIVNAKPEQRRRVLEDAAGIAGLHSRRHEAELRLKATEGNLDRLNDVLGQLTSQMDSLKRQARQARRYKDISGDIRRAEAIVLHLTWQDAHTLVEQEENDLAQALAQQGLATETERRAIRAEAEAGEAMQPLREAEAQRGAAVARLKIEQANLEREAERASQRAMELGARSHQITADLERERRRLSEAGEALAGLLEERQKLADTEDQSAGVAKDLSERAALCERGVTEAEQAFNAITEQAIAEKARRDGLAQRQGEYEARKFQFASRLDNLQTELTALRSSAPEDAIVARLRKDTVALEQKLQALQDQMTEAEAAAKRAGEDSRKKREDSRSADLHARQIETEAATLGRLLTPDVNAKFPPVLDEVSVTPGFEAALAAALGDDLDASTAPNAPAQWRPPADTGGKVVRDPQLPEGVEPLTEHVTAPRELRRRLNQIGVVSKDGGNDLQPLLKPGQRLVSREGDLWRWDGYSASGEAPTAAAQRLAQKNRLTDVRREASKAQVKAKTLAAADQAAQHALAEAEDHDRQLRQTWRETQATHAEMQKQLADLERKARDFEQKSGALVAQRSEAADRLGEIDAQLAEVSDLVASLKDPALFEPELSVRRVALEQARGNLLEMKTSLAALDRERLIRSDRLNAIASERRRLEGNQTQATEQIATLEARGAETNTEIEAAEAVPARLEADRQRLMTEIQRAENARKAAADNLAAADDVLLAAVQTIRAVQAELAEVREARVRSEARLEAARDRRNDETRKIAEAFSVAPDACLASVGIEAGMELPAFEDIDRRLMRLKADRERLGGVNLQADDELETLTDQVDGMVREREDVEAAIAKLRAAIGRLNREGKQRLDEAFNSVNAHFQSLFTTLFGGGEARLEMLEGQDPLEGGLEIVAKPPGKKPTTLSLLSGGEQTLTALSLIFAVFLTNPSPICVLDEVDAPLDDANVDRFCTLMEKMADDTDTRFLVITHHPMTMARMNRLFGVTMAEKGISQLVSVDLATAERFAEAS